MESAGSLVIARIANLPTNPRPTEKTETTSARSSLTSKRKHGSLLRQKTLGSVFRGLNEVNPLRVKRTQSNPQPYPTDLTPDPSPLRPHCAAKDKIRLWRPSTTRNTLDALGRLTTLGQQDLELIAGVSLNSLQPTTQASYRSGLLAFHVFCDRKKITEELRAPVDTLIMKSFVATLAGIYSATTISNYTSAIRAWHIVHGISWDIGDPEMNAIIKGTKQMAPRSSTREKRKPMTKSYIEKLRMHFRDNNHLDVAVFSCLTTAFWSTARLREVTVQNLSAFDPEIHVKRSDVGTRINRNGLKMTTILIPEMKANQTKGEHIYWARVQ